MLISKIKDKLLPFLACLIIYLLLPSFGFNSELGGNLYLVLLILFLFTSQIKFGNYIFHIFNLTMFMYLLFNRSFSFEFLFIQLFFVTLYQDNSQRIIEGYFNKFTELLKKIKISKVLLTVSIFIFTLLTQNNFLNYEIIDHDVSTSLVIANDIFSGNLPYERVWDDKQPLFYFFNYIILFLVEKNLVYYKIFFDVFVFINAFLIFIMLLNRFNKGKFISVISSISYLSIMSLPWANAEYSETMSITFIGFAYYLILGDENKKIRDYLCGFAIGVSTLINIGSALFLVGFGLIVILKYRKNIIHKILFLFYGFSSVHLLVFLIYYVRGLSEIYLLTLFKIPLSYTSTETFFFYDLRVFIESIFTTNYFLSTIFLVLLFNSVNILNNLVNSKLFDIETISYIFFMFLSIVFFYLAGKGFYHHLLYLVFFVSISIGFIENLNLKAILAVSFTLMVYTYLFTIIVNSTSNIVNSDSLYEDYPIRNFSESINQNFNDNFTVLALDKVIVLFYLDKVNEVSIIHPTNHNESFIIDNFLDQGLIEVDYLENALLQRPDLIICSIKPDGSLFYKIDSLYNFSCDEKNFGSSFYYKINQDIFRQSEYYYNPNTETKILVNN